MLYCCTSLLYILLFCSTKWHTVHILHLGNILIIGRHFFVLSISLSQNLIRCSNGISLPCDNDNDNSENMFIRNELML